MQGTGCFAARMRQHLRVVLASVCASSAVFALGISSMEVIGAVVPSAATPVAHVAPRSFALSVQGLPSPGSCNSGPACCPPSGSGVDYYGNLLYGYDSQLGENLYLDAYLPQGASSPVPGVVVVHGGDFTSGTKCSNGPEATYMAQQGLAVFAIDYPLASSSQHPFLQAPADTALAVQWVRANAAALQTKPAELALWGTSAGAPIAFDASYEAAMSNRSAAVQAVVGWSGAYDWVTDYYADASAHPSDFQGAVDYLGCSNFIDSACFRNLLTASPITHVTRSDPPSLLVTSTDAGTSPGQCEVVNPQNTVEMATALQTHGAPVTIQATSACAHSIAYANDPIDPPGTGTMIENTTSWLLQTLASPPSPTVPSPLPPPITGPTVVTNTSSCPPPPGSNVNYTANLVYGQDFNNPIYLDAYLPQAVSGDVPAVIIVHGGGHVSGDKCDVSSEAIALAQNGIAAFAVSYPLATASQPTFPNPVYDVMNAVAWVRANAATYGVAPNEIGLWGGSAGGNLALSAALAAPLIQPSAAVGTVVDWSGTADTFELIGEYQQISSGFNLANTSWAKYLGCSDPWSQAWDPTANTCLVRYEQASPAQLIDPTPPPPTAAPAILVAASTDFTGNGTCEIVPPRQQEEVETRAQADGLTAQMDLNSLCAHAFAYDSTEFPATLAFLEAHLIPSSPASVTSVTGPAPSSNTAAAGGVTYTIGFTTSGSGGLSANASTITLTATSGTAFSASPTDYTVNGTAVGTGGIVLGSSGATTQITIPPGVMIAGGAAVTVVAANATNPPAGTYAMGVYTSSDTVAASTPAYTITAPLTGSAYTPVNPFRIVDTRCAGGSPPGFCASENVPVANAALGSIGAGQTEAVQIDGTGPGADQVPGSGVAAVVVNITVENFGGQSGYLALYPGSSAPAVSSINWVKTSPGAIANLATVQVSPAGTITVANGAGLGSVDYELDVQGYYTAPSGSSKAGLYDPLPPYRLADTRCVTNNSLSDCSGIPSKNKALTSFTAGHTENVSVDGSGGVPSGGVEAVVLNVTVVATTVGSGYVTVYPAGSTKATVSNVNWTQGETVPNRVTVRVSASGLVGVYSSAGAEVIVDVNGYYTDGSSGTQTGSLFNPISPTRYSDTRCSSSTPPADCSGITAISAANGLLPAIQPGGKDAVIVGGAGANLVPAGAIAFVGNLTAAGPTKGGFLALDPAQANPSTSDVNFRAGSTAANMVIGGLDSKGEVAVYNSASTATEILLDVTGYFGPST